MKNKIKRIIFLLIALLLLASILIPTVSRADENDEVEQGVEEPVIELRTINISTVDEFISFGQSCAYDSYSKGLTVLLDNDINLSGVNFEAIPIFYGTFDGQNHTISGINIDEIGSLMGLFCTVESGAKIKRLKVQGTINPTGTKSSVGMIAGRNLGTIVDCSASGSVTGDTDIGGITGINEETGSVERCVTRVSVTGFLHTGGIVGRNEGAISSCTNNGDVNITQQDSKLEVDSLDGLAMIANERNVSAINDVSDTGGIVGRSKGTITGCINNGQVGYNHVGYNSGGIVGIQDGIISGCRNYGTIYGRKDIGGIVGQFEPDITLKYGEDTKKTVDEELQSLNRLFKVLSKQINNSSQDMYNGVNDINGALGVIEGSMKDANEQLSDVEVFRMITTSATKIRESNNKLIDANNEFDTKADAEMTIIQKGVSDIRNELATISGATDSAVINARDQIGIHTDNIESQCTKINSERQHITDTLNTVQNFSSRINTIVADMTLSFDEKKEQIKSEIKKIQDTNINSVPKCLEKISSSCDVITEECNSIKNEIVAASGATDTNWVAASPKINQSADDISDAAGRLKVESNSFHSIAVVESVIIDKEITNIENISNQYFDSREDVYDTVVKQMAVVNKNVKDMADKGSQNSSAVNKTLNSIVNQIEDVQKAVLAMAEVPEYTVLDISDDIEYQQLPGQISACRNEGEILGDTNAGGIAGIMAMEVGDDPENDFDLQKNLWVDTTAILRAIVMTSDNTGKITVKNGDAGGIVGKCDVGAVYKATNTGSVEATGDNKCGGIAGSSKGSIIQSYVVCDLVGNDEVGGIVGEGTNIKNCYSMVRIESSGEKLGAIAGAASGEIEKNFFVLEQLRGIDRVNYEGKAWPIDYSEFIKTEELPEIFTKLYVDFVIDSHTIKRIPLSYGASISKSQIPNLPERDDSYGSWEEFERQNIRRSATINGVYEKWITTLSSGEEIPTMLTQGKFSPNAKLDVKEWVYDEPVDRYTVSNGYSYIVNDDKKDLPDTLIFRIRCTKDMGDSVALYKDNSLTMLQSTRDGNYLVLSAPVEGKIVLLQRENYSLFIIIISGTILIGGTIIYIIIRRRRKRRLQKKCRRRIDPTPSQSVVKVQKMEKVYRDECSKYTKYRGK